MKSGDLAGHAFRPRSRTHPSEYLSFTNVLTRNLKSDTAPIPHESHARFCAQWGIL